jgi:hypothetical protein
MSNSVSPLRYWPNSLTLFPIMRSAEQYYCAESLGFPERINASESEARLESVVQQEVMSFITLDDEQ